MESGAWTGPRNDRRSVQLRHRAGFSGTSVALGTPVTAPNRDHCRFLAEGVVLEPGENADVESARALVESHEDPLPVDAAQGHLAVSLACQRRWLAAPCPSGTAGPVVRAPSPALVRGRILDPALVDATKNDLPIPIDVESSRQDVHEIVVAQSPRPQLSEPTVRVDVHIGYAQRPGAAFVGRLPDLPETGIAEGEMGSRVQIDGVTDGDDVRGQHRRLHAGGG